MAIAAVAILGACKGKVEEKQPGTGTAAAAVDATPAGFDCTKVGARMGEVMSREGAVAVTPSVVRLFTEACIDDGWSEAASKCVIAIPKGEGADACFQQLAPYPMVAIAARLRQIGALPFQDPDTVDATDCEAATAVLGLAWALRAAKVAPPGTSARVYTELYQAVSSEVGERCTDQAWPDLARTCLARTKIPQELAQVDHCLEALTPETRADLTKMHDKIEAAVLDVRGPPSVATGGDDCAAVGDAMVKVWTLKAAASMAKHPDTARWDLDHLDELRAMVVAACTEDAWPIGVRTCITALKLPDEARDFQTCIEALPPATMDALTRRTEALEAERDQATGTGP